MVLITLIFLMLLLYGSYKHGKNLLLKYKKFQHKEISFGKVILHITFFVGYVILSISYIHYLFREMYSYVNEVEFSKYVALWIITMIIVICSEIFSSDKKFK